ncbi:MAG: hypothetical protein OEU93_00285 [Rubrivivax sp.]|nr:hypothetical protein [Rubrivivax sp.]
MPIVSHTHEFSLQADGSTSNVVRMYDQDAREYMQTFFAPAGFDVTAKIQGMIAGLDVQLAETEFRTLVGL